MPWMARLRDGVRRQGSLQHGQEHDALDCADAAVAWQAFWNPVLLVGMAGVDSSHRNSGIQEVLVAAEQLGMAVSGLDTANVDRRR